VLERRLQGQWKRRWMVEARRECPHWCSTVARAPQMKQAQRWTGRRGSTTACRARAKKPQAAQSCPQQASRWSGLPSPTQKGPRADAGCRRRIWRTRARSSAPSSVRTCTAAMHLQHHRSCSSYADRSWILLGSRAGASATHLQQPCSCTCRQGVATLRRRSSPKAWVQLAALCSSIPAARAPESAIVRCVRMHAA
jgi:hypothetical protein